MLDRAAGHDRACRAVRERVIHPAQQVEAQRDVAAVNGDRAFLKRDRGREQVGGCRRAAKPRLKLAREQIARPRVRGRDLDLSEQRRASPARRIGGRKSAARQRGEGREHEEPAVR